MPPCRPPHRRQSSTKVSGSPGAKLSCANLPQHHSILQDSQVSTSGASVSGVPASRPFFCPNFTVSYTNIYIYVYISISHDHNVFDRNAVKSKNASTLSILEHASLHLKAEFGSILINTSVVCQ